MEMTPPPFDLPDPVALAIPLFAVLVIAEMVHARATGKTSYEAADAGASLLMGLGNLVSKLLFGSIAVVASVAAYQVRLFEIGWVWWAFVLCFFAEDLAYYWFHRVSHERRWFWAAHVVHHSSQHYNLSTALRQTWTGNLGFAWLFWVPMSLIGFHPAMVALFSGISLVYQFWIHTEAIKRLPGWFEWLFNTPSHHRVHHASNPRYLDSNYAGVLIIWDRLFGSFVPELDSEPPRYGLTNNLATFNPLRIAFHEWAGIGRDMLAASGWRERLGYLFGPPGWSPDGSRETSAMVKARWQAGLGAAAAEPDQTPGADAATEKAG